MNAASLPRTRLVSAPPGVDVAWVLSGGMKTPGARIHGVNLHQQLLKAGVRSVILRGERFSQSISQDECRDLLNQVRCVLPQAIVIQKLVGENALALAREARALGVRVIFHACDIVDNDMASMSDVCLAGSDFLVGLYQRKHRRKFHLLDDAIETPERLCNREIEIPQHGRLKAVYLSSSFPDKHLQRLLNELCAVVDVTVLSRRSYTMDRANAKSAAKHAQEGPVRKLANAFKEHRWGIVRRLGLQVYYRMNQRRMMGPSRASDSTEQFSFVEWDLETASDVMANHHIGLIPSVLNSNFKMSKSSNRLATLMSCGLAVVTSPVPSYLPHIQAGKNAVVARTYKEWLGVVDRLDRDRQLVQQLADLGRAHAFANFSRDVIATRLLQIIDSCFI